MNYTKTLSFYCIIVFAALLISKPSFSQTLPDISISVLDENTSLKQTNSNLPVPDDTLPHNYLFTITVDTAGTKDDTLSARGYQLAIKVGESTGGNNFFSGTFYASNTGTVPDRCYYGIKDNKHFIKVYLQGITSQSPIKYQVTLSYKNPKTNALTTASPLNGSIK